MKVKEVEARLIKNSRGENAIEVAINKRYVASAPSGASTGKHEVQCFSKKGIKWVIEYINKNKKQLIGKRFEEFNDLEVVEEFSDLGGNTVIALQFALLKAMSSNKIYSFLDPRAKVLPVPLGNCIGGGAHTKGKSTDIQEYLLIPKARTFRERMLANRHAYNAIKKKLKVRKVTDEGALVPNMSSVECLEFLKDFLDDKDNTLGYKVNFGLDVAASQFFKKDKYVYKNFSSEGRSKKFSREEQIDLINSWISEYSLKYVEDPLEEEDFKGFSKLDKRTLICGDDLVTTNLHRLKTALRLNSVNTIIVKPNQIGSLIETKRIVDFAKSENIDTVISHRSGETMDVSIAHLAVGWRMPYIKTGIFGKEREVKLKELLKIEDGLK